MTIRIGTRGSDLALAQALAVQRDLEAMGEGTELVIVKTTGDLDLSQSFADLGPAGVFAVELRIALLKGEVDIAVHSAKDLPSQTPEGLVIVAAPERVAAHDRLLILPEHHDPEAKGLPLREGARLGTAAARRTALAKSMRPDLEIQTLRGNVPTRIQKLKDGEHDAILLAAAGLDRLHASAARGECEPPSLDGLIIHDMNPEEFTPAPGQGAIAIEARAEDTAAEIAARLNDPSAKLCLDAERVVLSAVDAGCHTPFGVWCREVDPGLAMTAFMEVDGVLRTAGARGEDPAVLGAIVAGELLGREA